MSTSQQLTKELWTKYFDGDKIKTVLLGCDGVIWLGNSIIPGAVESIARLKSLGKRVILVTNSSLRRRSVVEKCEKLGIRGIVEEDVVTTSVVLCDYLKNVIKFGAAASDADEKGIYVVGPQEIVDELESVGIPSFDCRNSVGPDVFDGSKNFDENIRSMTYFFTGLEIFRVGAVVVGFDQHISYKKILKASALLHARDVVHFIATSDDEMIPSTNPNLVFPGAGSMVSMISTASGRVPTVLGKPYEPMFDYIKRKYELKPSETCMVGDSFRTDIQFGKKYGMRTLLVFTGNEKKEKLEKVIEEKFVPDFYCDSLGDLVKLSDV